jgi:Kdo2-lipid IVA lauroyltransferase/acyltransferase
LKLAFRFLAWLPLGANHALGAFLGRLAFILPTAFRRYTLENLRASGLCTDEASVRKLAWESAAEVGKGATELAHALFRPIDEVAALVTECIGLDAVVAAHAEGRALIFAFPHLGGYDIAGRYLWTKVPIVVMTRRHKLAWLDELLREGRIRGAESGRGNVVEASLSGVRETMRNLKHGGASFILPDQVPGQGEGEWSDFFGRPAYTMTLIQRLQHASKAVLVFGYAERLGGGRGFRLHLETLREPLPEDRAAAARAVNARIEALVRQCPAQYLWGYNRYKRPAGAPPAPQADAREAA